MDARQLHAAKGAAALSQAVIKTLEAAVRKYEQNDESGCEGELKFLQPDIVLLTEVSQRMADVAQRAKDNNDRLSIRMEIIIGNLGRSEATAKSAIEATQVNLKRDASGYQTDLKKLGELQAEIAALQSEIDEIRGRYEEAVTWCWVPGYNVYLAGRAFADTIEGKLGRLSSALNELNQHHQENAVAALSQAQAQANLARLAASIGGGEAEVLQLQAQRMGLENQNKIYNGRVTQEMNKRLFYRDLGVALQGIAKNLESVINLARRLKNTVESYASDGSARTIPFKEALIQAAGEYDNFRPVNGGNARFVDYGGAAAVAVTDDPFVAGFGRGVFLQTGKKEWTEFSAEKAKTVFRFNETGRDDWSVYLHDAARGVNIQLDLWTSFIYYSDAKTAKRQQYRITSASDRVNGLLAVAVDVGTPGSRLASFVDAGQKRWAEHSPHGAGFEFDETSRDAWSIYLSDRSRGVALQLDLWTRTVFYSDRVSPRRPQYSIIGAS